MPALFQHLSITALNDSHKFEKFDCGDAARNAWLQSRALASRAQDDSRCYVAADPDGRVFGFYAIATGAILRSALPGALRRNAPDPVSCILLAQLGAGLSCQGQGVGRELVLHAMGQAVKIAEIVSCRLLVVHPAPPEQAAYYHKFGFISIDAAPGPVMAMSLGTIRATLAAL